MKRKLWKIWPALAVLLMLAIGALAEDWMPDITCLMESSDVPVSSSVEFDSAYPAGTQLSTHEHVVRKVNSRGITMGVEFELEADTSLTDAAWKQADSFLQERVTAAIQGVATDTEAMARAIAGSVELAAHDGWQLKRVTVTIPYYKGLSLGATGDDVQDLQRRLILNGFLTGTADGSYGANTAAGVKSLQKYIRLLEQDVIDDRVGPQPTAVPSTVAPDGTQPTAAPVKRIVPLTEMNGEADGLLVNYFCSERFIAIRGSVKAGDSGIEVTRIQTRLKALDYMLEEPDGRYGDSVSRAVKLFQYYNGLEITGTADRATQEKLFSEKAVKAPYTALTEGSRGDEVTKLQTRLKYLGFTNDEPDAIYGSSTTAVVKLLQGYMKEKGMKATGANGSELAIAENGIADCLTLELFYSDAFPAIPGTQQNGSKGQDVVRMQRRLTLLKYYTGTMDGAYGTGTADAVKSFQMRHGLSQTGIADAATLRVLFSEDAKVALKPYQIYVSKAEQKVYVYTYDQNGEYTNCIRTMVCSTGKSGNDTETPSGTFTASTGPGKRWHYFTKWNCWAQYAYYIQGDIMFHSVLFGEKDGPVTQSSVNNLGRKASHGCVRLAVEDAKWIWEHCPEHTKVIIE